MNEPCRPVDLAMAEDRPEKRTIRALWIEEVKSVAAEYPEDDIPWYLTLSGAQGRDIQLLIDEGLISLTEVNSIAAQDQGKVVAVENNSQAILILQKRFIGLRICEVPFQNLVRGEGLFSWPQGEHEKLCRARVINLDLNASLSARFCEEEIIFPVLSWIRKLCQIHSRPPRIDWTLCLTLHGEINWPQDVNPWTRDFFSENLQREAIFANGCRELFGEEFLDILTQDDCPDFTDLDREDQQRFIMVIVPKIITRLVHNDGWRVQTDRNLRYGGVDRALMVTWIFKFAWDGTALARPNSLYRSGLRDILARAGTITETGLIE